MVGSYSYYEYMMEALRLVINSKIESYYELHDGEYDVNNKGWVYGSIFRFTQRLLFYQLLIMLTIYAIPGRVCDVFDKI